MISSDECISPLASRSSMKAGLRRRAGARLSAAVGFGCVEEVDAGGDGVIEQINDAA